VTDAAPRVHDAGNAECAVQVSAQAEPDPPTDRDFPVKATAIIPSTPNPSPGKMGRASKEIAFHGKVRSEDP
jgi:hypothetical protein